MELFFAIVSTVILQVGICIFCFWKKSGSVRMLLN